MTRGARTGGGRGRGSGDLGATPGAGRRHGAGLLREPSVGAGGPGRLAGVLPVGAADHPVRARGWSAPPTPAAVPHGCPGSRRHPTYKQPRMATGARTGLSRSFDDRESVVNRATPGLTRVTKRSISALHATTSSLSVDHAQQRHRKSGRAWTCWRGLVRPARRCPDPFVRTAACGVRRGAVSR